MAAIRNVGGGPPPRVGASNAAEPATPSKAETPSASEAPAGSKTSASGFTPSGAKAARSTLALPLSTAPMDPARAMAGARGVAVANQLARLWRRLPGEKRIPKRVRDTLLAELPSAPWEAEKHLSEDDVADYLSKRNKHAQTKELHAGMSGAQVFDVKGDAEQSGIFKLFGDPEEMFQDIAGLEVIASVGNNVLNAVGVKQVGKNRDGSKGFVLMEKAGGKVLFDRMDQVAASTMPERVKLQTTLCAELAAAGKAMGGFHQAAQSTVAVPTEYKRQAALRTYGLFDSARAKASTGSLADAALQTKIEARLRGLTREFMQTRLQATISIGDIHPGNMAVQGDKCTVFDVNTLVASLGSRGEGLAPSADDRTWFAEAIPWDGGKIGLDAVEVAAAKKSFLDAYKSACSFATGADDAIATTFYRVRSAMTDLRFAPNSQKDLNLVLSLLDVTP